MSFARVYLRVLGLLGAEVRLAVTLALANIALAAAQFVEPVLFGRIVDALSGALPAGIRAAALALAPLLGAWVAFGLFIIVAGTVIAWFADRLAHQRRNLVLADYFEHVLQLPLAYHTGEHSGRQMKIMLSGTDTLWWLWVSFFREHFAAFVFIALLLPATLVLNWRLALPLIVLCIGFTALTVLVMQRAYAMQRTVEQHYSDLAETAADALGNVALVQSYARVELEVSLAAQPGELAAARADAGAVVVGGGERFDARRHHAHAAGDPPGRDLSQAGRACHGRPDRQLHEHRGAVDRAARAGGQLRQPAVPRRAEIVRLLRRARYRAVGARPARARSIPAACTAMSNSRMCRFPTTASVPPSSI